MNETNKDAKTTTYMDENGVVRKPRKVGKSKQELNKQYYLSHRNKIYENQYKQVECKICKKTFSNHYLSKHRKTKGHIWKATEASSST